MPIRSTMIPRRRSRASVLMLATLCVSCGSAGRPGLADAPLRTVDADGVELVNNVAPIRWLDTTGWRIREERATVIPDTGACGLGRVSSATLGPDGRLYVAGRQPLAVRVFSAEGECVGTIGREGAGPGEYQYAMLGVTDSAVLVQDPLQTRLTRFGPDGSVREMVGSPCCLLGPVLPVLRGGRVALPMVKEDRRGWLLMTPTGEIDSVWIPEPPRDMGQSSWRFGVPDGRTGELREVAVGIPYAPEFVAAIAPDGTVISGTTDEYRLTIAGADGSAIRIIEAVAPVAPVPDSLRARAYEVARQGMGVRAYVGAMERLVRRSDIPVRRPAWSAVRGDEAGRLWVGLPSGHRAIDLLHVFDPTGALLGAVPAPHGGLLGDRAVWQREKVILPDTDADGRPVVRVFAIDTELR